MKKRFCSLFRPLPSAALFLSLFLLLPPPLAANAGNLPDTDLPGGDYRNFSLISPVPSFCEKVCDKDTRCRAWTFSWPGKRGKRAKCFLKEKVTKKTKDTCCISGVKGGFSWPGGKTRPPEEKTAGPAAEEKTPPAKTPGEEKEKPEVVKKPLPPVAGSGRETAQAHEPQREEPGNRADAAASRAETASAGGRDAARRAACLAYAEEAMRAKRLNAELGCGYSGGRWNASRKGYFNWCMKNSPEAARANTKIRARLIARCQGRAQDAPTAEADLESCARFARLASALARRALRNNCGFFGPWWTTDEDRIFNWCRTVPVARRRAALAARRAALLRCEAGMPPRRVPPGEDGGYAPPPPPPAVYRYKWTKLRGPGPAWSTPWRVSRSGKCPLFTNCACGGGGSCRMYNPGEATLWWPNGCRARPWVILCQTRGR